MIRRGFRMLTATLGLALTILTLNAATAQAVTGAATEERHRTGIPPIVIVVLVIAAGVGFFLYRRKRTRTRDRDHRR